MKKTLAVLIALLICISIFSGCDTETPVNVPTTEPSKETASPTDAPEEPTNGFSNMTPVDGSEVVLVPDDLNTWIQSYTDSSKYFSSKSVTTPISNNKPVPVVLSWDFDKEVNSFVVYITKNIEDTENAIVITTTEKSVTVENLDVATTYSWAVLANLGGESVRSKVQSFTTASTPKLLNVTGLENARDIGGVGTSFGGKIKQNIVYRTGNIEYLSEESIKTLNETYKIKTELDLRYETEVAGKKTSVLGDSVKYVNAQASQYFQLLTSAYPGSFRKQMKLLLDETNFPIDIHCSVGRDRTGTLIAVIYALCGVDELTIVRDYELSFVPNDDCPNLMGTTADSKMGEYFLPFLSQMKIAYGTDNLTIAAERMMQDRGFTADEINKIRKNLIENYTDQVISEWNDEKKPISDQDNPIMSWTGDKIATDLIVNSNRTGISSFVASEDKTYSTITASETEAVIYPFRGNVNVQMGSVIAIKYRSKDLGDDAYFEVFVDSKNEDAVGGSNTRQNLISDGEWHVMIINLEEKIGLFNGYSAKYLRLDLMNRAKNGQKIDYSFIGLFTSVESATNYLAGLS